MRCFVRFLQRGLITFGFASSLAVGSLAQWAWAAETRESPLAEEFDAVARAMDGRQYELALHMLDRMSKSSPDDPRFRRQLAVAFQGLYEETQPRPKPSPPKLLADSQSLLPENEGSRWRVTWEPSLGVSTYEEDTGRTLSNRLTSKWNALVYGGCLGADNYAALGAGLRGRLSLRTLTSDSQTETWFVNGQKFQTNDMDFWGVMPGLEVGYVFQPDVPGQDRLTPFLGYEFRYIRFARSNFNILNLITSRDIVTESYNFHLLWGGVRGYRQLGPKWNLEGMLSLGGVVDNSADNSTLGTIEGHGGWIFRTEAGLQRVWKSWAFGLGGFFDHQRLEGGSTGAVVWPDNELDAYGGRFILTRYW